jgi:hypothetical protein
VSVSTRSHPEPEPGPGPVPADGDRRGDDATTVVRGLNPAQERVLDLLGAAPDERPTFDPALAIELRSVLDESLAPLVEHVPEHETLWLNKHGLSQVHGCEAKLLAEVGDEFTWSPPLARGVVTHKAIELPVNWRGEIAPLDVVDEALAGLERRENGLAVWLASCSELERAELRAQVNERVAKFVETFPPLRKQWVPVTETSLRIELCDGRIVLQGRIDLTLGQPQGTTARKVLIDLKTGGFSPAHLDDLRFYALLDTLRLGIPPRLLASFYLDSGEPRHERVTEGLLEAALRRTVEGATRYVELVHRSAPPTKRTGPACRWCTAQADCAEGRAWLAGDDEWG